jgi:hypothetical protein
MLGLRAEEFGKSTRESNAVILQGRFNSMSQGLPIDRRTFLEGLAVTSAGLWIGMGSPRAVEAESARDLEESFVEPPASARPWVYWFWINGNLTREGITADLEAMKRVGIGGVLIMEVDGSPQGRIAFGTEPWKEMFRFACLEANRLGLEINMNNDAGWTGSGGPWITPDLSMQRVLWSEVVVEGGREFDSELPQPEPQAGRRRRSEGSPSKVAGGSDYYSDIAVLAFLTPQNPSYRLEDIEFKADFEAGSTPPGMGMGIPLLPIHFDPAPADSVIDPDRILDITAHYRNGRLTWEAPAGIWTVLRFGHGSTRASNHPCPPAGQGLECDKLSKAAVELHFRNFMGELLKLIGPLSGKTLVSTHVDSWEAGAQNWTPLFREEFQKRRGYDLLPFLPVMTGRAVGNSEISERFLWDLRKTVSDLIAENYFGHLRALANASGLRFSAEAYDGDPMDEMTTAAYLDEPQTEFWYRREDQPLNEAGDFGSIYRSYAWAAAMASAAHTNGRKILASEAFTAMPGENWLGHPATLKPLGDWALCMGVNRFVFHRYAMQPFLNCKPGMTMAFWGQHYERTQTWWEESKPWHEYLTRCQYLLRQGLFVADLLYLETEAAPNRFMPPGVDMKNPVPPDPPGYNFDGCTADTVHKRIAIREGRIVLPDGMSYRLLVLPKEGEQVQAGLMTPELLKRIEQLVNEGMTVVGPRPFKSPSLTNYPNCDKELSEIADRLWGGDAAPSGDRKVGLGRVVWGFTPQEVLTALGVASDFACGNPAPFRYIHRRTEDGTDIYFVANKNNQAAEAVCSFRVSGRRPEFWWPENGRIERIAVYEVADGVTRVPVMLNQFGSIFVIFRADREPEADRVTAIVRNGRVLKAGFGNMIQVSRPRDGSFRSLVWQSGQYDLRLANGKEHSIDVPFLPGCVRIDGPWELRFTPGWGAPPRVQLAELMSWTEHSDPDIRYFSGRATYTKQMQIPSSMVDPGRALFLSLGEVGVIASVKLNGRQLGILWRAPFQIDVTGAAREGVNSLEVTVVNLWPNRIIGDEQLPDDCEWVPFAGFAQPPSVGQGTTAVQASQPAMYTLRAFPQWLLNGKPSPTGRYTFSIIKVWSKDSPLLRSGLLGPVELNSAAIVS